jgi:hypothetical protein
MLALKVFTAVINVNDMDGTDMSHTLRNSAGDSRPPATKDASCELAGLRVQLMKALNYVHHGSLLVYRLETTPVESEAQRMLGEYFVENRNWLSDKIVPMFVPGTLCPEVVGDLLVRFGWVKPANDDSFGYTRKFVLSEEGEKALEAAKAWWNSLGWFQKAWLTVME